MPQTSHPSFATITAFPPDKIWIHWMSSFSLGLSAPSDFIPSLFYLNAIINYHLSCALRIILNSFALWPPAWTLTNSQLWFPMGISNSREPKEIPFRSVIFLLLLCFSTSEGPQNVPSYLNQKSESHAWSPNGPPNLHSTASNSLLNLSLYIARATALVHRPLLFLRMTKKNSTFVSQAFASISPP